MAELFYRPIDKTELEPYQINCSKCMSLCCITLYFSKTDGFPEDKISDIPCKNLQSDHKCKIHSLLLKQGLKGCMSYDCFGAGQNLCKQFSSLPNWETFNMQKLSQAFLTVTKVHQTLWYLKEASYLTVAYPSKNQFDSLLREGEKIAESSIDDLCTYNIESFRSNANTLMKEICFKVSQSLGISYNKD